MNNIKEKILVDTFITTEDDIISQYNTLIEIEKEEEKSSESEEVIHPFLLGDNVNNRKITIDNIDRFYEDNNELNHINRIKHKHELSILNLIHKSRSKKIKKWRNKVLITYLNLIILCSLLWYFSLFGWFLLITLIWIKMLKFSFVNHKTISLYSNEIYWQNPITGELFTTIITKKYNNIVELSQETLIEIQQFMHIIRKINFYNHKDINKMMSFDKLMNFGLNRNRERLFSEHKKAMEIVKISYLLEQKLLFLIYISDSLHFYHQVSKTCPESRKNLDTDIDFCRKYQKISLIYIDILNQLIKKSDDNIRRDIENHQIIKDKKIKDIDSTKNKTLKL